eukprot:TRINITY_DN32242_c0_g1_i1.p2 TRINITY_DN32242_c0_g1~~TRINITY_DN32242_c0_g1_i1.p2  ORF type:complete len:150 (+),score=10.10 TRINITY_DN32242_c0_g1_i1:319-768(+)
MELLPPAPPEAWLNAFKSIVETGIDSRIRPLVTRFDNIENRQTSMEQHMKTFNDRLLAVETKKVGDTNSSSASTTAETYKASRLEIKGFGKHTERLAHGVTRAKAMELWEVLRKRCPEEIHSKISQPTLTGARATSFLVQKFSGSSETR